ncbi:MAG: FAD-dependent oxidoreductase [Gemmatimonadota bacterium]
MSPRTAIVVGSGVFGATAALELRRRGMDVVLLERSSSIHPDASSTDVSKMVRMDYGSDVFYHELAEAALEGWDRWNRDWPEPAFHDEGFLVLAPGPMQAGGFEYESWRVLRERGYHPERLDAGAISERFPLWNAEHFPDGYLSRRGGWAPSGAVVQQLLRLCSAAGVQRLEGRATRLSMTGTRVTGVDLHPPDGRPISITADETVVCAGAWTPELVPEIAEIARAVAQPVLHFGVDPEAFRGPQFPPFAADISGTGWYGFPAADYGFVKLGHHSDGSAVRPDEKGRVPDSHVQHARSFLRVALPALADAPVVGSRMCLYCDTFDGDLLVARDPDREGITVATGGSGHAFKFAPELGSIVADVVLGQPNRWARRFSWRDSGPTRAEEARHLSTRADS